VNGDFPLGAPTNRPAPKALAPIPGRPNWFKDKDDREIYVEPPRPPEAAPK